MKLEGMPVFPEQMKEARETAWAWLSASLCPAEQVAVTISHHLGSFNLQLFLAGWVSMVASEEQHLVGLPVPSKEG